MHRPGRGVTTDGHRADRISSRDRVARAERRRHRLERGDQPVTVVDRDDGPPRHHPGERHRPAGGGANAIHAAEIHAPMTRGVPVQRSFERADDLHGVHRPHPAPLSERILLGGARRRSVHNDSKRHENSDHQVRPLVPLIPHGIQAAPRDHFRVGEVRRSVYDPRTGPRGEEPSCMLETASRVSG